MKSQFVPRLFPFLVVSICVTLLCGSAAAQRSRPRHTLPACAQQALFKERKMVKEAEKLTAKCEAEWRQELASRKGAGAPRRAVPRPRTRPTQPAVRQQSSATPPRKTYPITCQQADGMIARGQGGTPRAHALARHCQRQHGALKRPLPPLANVPGTAPPAGPTKIKPRRPKAPRIPECARYKQLKRQGLGQTPQGLTLANQCRQKRRQARAAASPSRTAHNPNAKKRAVAKKRTTTTPITVFGVKVGEVKVTR